MIKRNPFFGNLAAGYLFPEIAKRRREFIAANPQAKVISLGIGNTTEPLTPHIVDGMMNYVKSLGTKEGYSGYGDEQGLAALRTKIAQVFYKTSTGKNLVNPEEVFISDGAKCDIGRIQFLFGNEVGVAVQDPAYPVYVDGSVIVGAASAYENTTSHCGYRGICYLPCTPENNFFPHLDTIQKKSLIYFCSPNNPTGAVATKAELKKLVDFALHNECIIIFDAAYSEYIRDANLPKSIFEIEGARKCAIEISSFSKPIGFTGVRLGWSIVPIDLLFSDGTPVINDWNRIMTTLFNGASNIAQHGGLAALDEKGLTEMRGLTDFYLENAQIIKKAVSGENFKKNGVRIYGGENAPYIWATFPKLKSWDVFTIILNQCHVVTTPGSGFGPAGESFIRFSAFGHREDILEAAIRLEKLVF